MGGRLQHWQYDTFIARFDDPEIEPAYVTFCLGAEGKVERITMKAGVTNRGFQFRLPGSAFHSGALTCDKIRKVHGWPLSPSSLATSTAVAQDLRARVSRVLKETPLIDGHNDLPDVLREREGEGRWTVDLRSGLGNRPEPYKRISPGCDRAWSAANSGPYGCLPICRDLNR